MILHKVLSFLAFVLLFGSNEFCEQKVQQVYIRNVRCANISSKYAHSNVTCYAKSFNRTCSTGTVMAWSKIPWNNFKIDAKLYFRYGNIYREVLHLDQIDWCAIMKVSEVSNPLLLQLIKVLRDVVPGLLHECPYNNWLVYQVGIKTGSLASLFPTGDYKFTAALWAEDGELIGTVEFVASLKTPIRDTFG